MQDLEATEEPLLADLSLHPRLLQILADQRQILRPGGGIGSGICELVLLGSLSLVKLDRSDACL